jgi:glutaredoxin
MTVAGATVTLYGRPGCCLCDEVREMLEPLRRELGFELVERDITLDDALHRAFLERIPVVEVDGAITSELQLDESALRAALQRVRHDRSPARKFARNLDRNH